MILLIMQIRPFFEEKEKNVGFHEIAFNIFRSSVENIFFL
jgi:hypothetical protein